MIKFEFPAHVIIKLSFNLRKMNFFEHLEEKNDVMDVT